MPLCYNNIPITSSIAENCLKGIDYMAMCFTPRFDCLYILGGFCSLSDTITRSVYTLSRSTWET